MFVGLQYTNHGNYKCLFCNHKVWKRADPGIKHVTDKHLAERAELLAKQLEEAQNKQPLIKYRERVVYKDKPTSEKKYWEGPSVIIFCETEQIVYQHISMPRGQSIEETPCHGCGTRTLKLVKELR